MPLRRFWFWALAFVGALQLLAAVTAISWAWPLFADPPFLANGLVREYHQVAHLLTDTPAAEQPLALLHQKLGWLFSRHHEGVNLGMGFGVAFALSGAFSLLLAATIHRVSPPART